MAHALVDDLSLSFNAKRRNDMEVICDICNKTFDAPRVLDCLHTFCESCLENNLEIEEREEVYEYFVKCNTCGKQSSLPMNGVKSLPINVFAKNAIDLMIIEDSKDSAVKCTNCKDDEDAMSRCVECTEFLCSLCVTAHRRFRMAKDHRIIMLDALKHDRSTVHRPVHCPLHEPEHFLFFCEVCQELICKECTILMHRGHKFESLKEALEQKKPCLMKDLETCEKKIIPPLEKAIDEVHDMSARLHARTVSVKQAVRACADELVQRIEQKCKEMLEDIENLYLSKNDILQNQKEKLDLQLTKSSTVRDFVDYAFKHGNEAEIFQMYDVMQVALEDVNGFKFDYKEPEENDVIEHIVDSEEVRKIAKHLGKISTSRVFLANCLLEGPGLATAKVGIETHFTIHTRDVAGGACIESDHDNTIRTKIQAPEGFYVNNKFSNNKDGSYTVRYTPVTKGKHQITVKIRGKHIPNNKHIVRVCEGIDYAKIETTFMTFGCRGNKNGEFKEPYAVSVNFAGYIYVTDFLNNRVQAFESMGKHFVTFGTKGSRDGQFLGPTGIAADSTGIVFVSDWDNHRIQLFSPNGKFIGKFGKIGKQTGQLCHPAGLAVDKNGLILVAERDNHRVQVFTLDGKSVLTFGRQGNEKGQLDSPTHVAVTQDNNYVVSDSGNNRIVLYDKNGSYIRHVGCKGSGPGEFMKTAGIVVDDEGYIIVSDFYNHRIQVFTPDLEQATIFGEEGNGEMQFKFPTGVTLNGEGRVVIADRHNNRIQIF